MGNLASIKSCLRLQSINIVTFGFLKVSVGLFRLLKDSRVLLDESVCENESVIMW